MNKQHNYAPTIYVNDRETQLIFCNKEEIGAIQRTKTGNWIPRYGIGIQAELPSMSEGKFNPAEAIQWIENKHKCEEN